MSSQEHQSFISHTENLPEITVKAVVISILLTVILAASNAYLGMKVGITISASIPAAVIAMGILHFFKNHNVLEINIVQTAASAGEALVAGTIFTIPALLVIHFWFGFHYLTTVILTMVGGTIGVLFSILLRRVLLADKTLSFPEGVAIGNVLKATARKTVGLKYLVQGGLLGTVINFFQTGLHVMADSSAYWMTRGASVFGFSMDFSPALLAAGFIVGVNVAISILVGIIIGWFILMPVFAVTNHIDLSNLAAAAHMIHSEYLRYVGVGTLIAAGIWTVLNLVKPIYDGIQKSLESMRSRYEDANMIIRTDRDIPFNYAAWITLALLIPICILLYCLFTPTGLGITPGLFWVVLVAALMLIIIVGFIVSSVSGYFAGMMGTSNSPISSMTIVSALLISLVLSALMSSQIDYKTQVALAHEAAGLLIIIVTVVACSAAITNDTIQDLKAGQMVGATPWKQQVMLIIGVISAALLIPAILELLFQAYGIAGIYPREGMDPDQMLAAPQANLVATIASGVFGGAIKWSLLLLGIGIGVVCIVIDEFLKRRGTRLPAIGVGSAIYLPLGLMTTFALGGFLSYLIKHHLHKKTQLMENPMEHIKISFDRVTLLACGLVAGASLMGVILAIPFAISKSTDILAIMPASLSWLCTPLSLIAMLGLMIWVYQTALNKKHFKLSGK